ncbi:MAG: ATP synthase F1 subunit gamma [Candidatus Omnitrophota bacterium]|nr:ATP synthase F1 subunit gamma [Candidatus Omnitrophota bacterium]
MAQSLREIKSRIRGIGNVNKVTHAMEMISIAKLRPVKNRLFPARRYSLKIDELLRNLSAGTKGVSHPFMEQRENIKRIAICLVTSDTGLCGSYNNNAVRVVEDFINRYGHDKITLFPVGRKGLVYFKKKGVDMAGACTELHGRYSDDMINKISKDLTRIFLSKAADEIYIVYASFESASRSKPVIERLLPVSVSPGRETGYIFEPDVNTILKELMPLYLANKIKSCILSAFTAEHSARAIAMGQATENAKELLEDLTLVRNKIRQAGITKDIMEIVSSADVLK